MLKIPGGKKEFWGNFPQGMDASGTLHAVFLRNPPDEGDLRMLRQHPGEIILTGWRLPERNLDYPAYWMVRMWMECRNTGQRAAFRAFLQSHGVEGLAAISGRAILERIPVIGGSAARIRLSCPDGSRQHACRADLSDARQVEFFQENI